MIKIKKSRIIIAIIVLIVIGYFGFSSLFKNETDGYITEIAEIGEVLQEVSETGNVRSAEDISLSFKTVGKISKIYASVGDSVKKGDAIVELDASQLFAQLQGGLAGLEAAQKQYDKLLSGSTQEDIKPYQDAVASAEHNLKSSYDGALNEMEDAYTKIYNAYTLVVSIKNDYFSAQDQEGIKVQVSRDNINKEMQSVKEYLDLIKANNNYNEFDNAISGSLSALDSVYDDLKIIRTQCDEGIYYSKVSSADKTLLDTQKGYIYTAISSITSSQQSVGSYKIALQTAENNLSIKTADPRMEDIDIYKAQINQAQASVDLLRSQLSDNYLRSPINGIVTRINAKRGETVSPGAPVIDMLSSEPFQIKTNIYEQDIVNVKIGDLVRVNLIAFPKETFLGKVVLIDPAEKIVDNVVYYEVTIDFPNQADGIRSGMTADIVIETNKKENVLMIPKNAIEKMDGKEFVEIIKNKKVETREIVTGLEGNYYYEVVSGLKEGDEIITGKK